MQKDRQGIPKSRKIKYLLLVLIGLMVADGMISRFLVTSGLGREWNHFLQGHVGQDYFLILKLVFGLLCALILFDVYRTRPRAAMVVTVIFVLFYTGIVFWNVGVYLATSAQPF